MATTTSLAAAYSFAIEVIGPVPMPMETYHITFYELLSQSMSQKENRRVVFKVLSERVLANYNKHIEDCPILDMFDDPDKYKTCLSVEWVKEFSSLESVF